MHEMNVVFLRICSKYSCFACFQSLSSAFLDLIQHLQHFTACFYMLDYGIQPDIDVMSVCVCTLNSHEIIFLVSNQYVADLLSLMGLMTRR